VRQWRDRIRCVCAAGAMALAALPAALAQDDEPRQVSPSQAHEEAAKRERRILELQAKATAAIDKRDYAEAERLLRENLELDPGSFVVLYNLACMRSLQRDPDGAGELLKRSIEAGFIDVYRLRSDPDLGAARKSAAYQTIIQGWPKILVAQLESNLKQTGKIFSGRAGTYVTTRDQKLRIAVVSAMDPVSTEQAHADISRLYDWALLNVFPELADEAKATDDAWTVVVLPTPRDFRKWLVATYGIDAVEGMFGVGGEYDNDRKRLVAMDLGATLRHEFFHVLHWRSAIRLGQDHPVWIQEGLCSLVEDYELGPKGEAASLHPVPSWRTNIAKRLMSGGKLLTIKQLATIRRDRFTSASPLANYGQARTFFLYLLQSGKLKEWYAHYTSHYDEDPTGVKSIEAVFGKPVAQVDHDYRAWIKSLPMVPEQLHPGGVGIGADVETGDGDGPVIVSIPEVRGRGSPAREAGLRVGDVITAVNDQPTRDLNELVRVLGEHKPGDKVEIAYRRGKVHATARITLEER
jgi:tetratricopeptide (TPR) repeat protein